MDVKIRPMDRQDILAIARIVEETWEMSSYGEQVSYPASEAYSLRCYNAGTFAYAAVIGEEVVGCVIGGNFPNRLRNMWSLLSVAGKVLRLRNLPGYREFMTDIDLIDRSYEDMLRSSEAIFDAQLELLIVSPEHRGKGVGKALYEAAMDEFRKRGKHSVLIFTDDDCGYGFYDRDGCERLETREIRLSSEMLCNMMYRKNLDVK